MKRFKQLREFAQPKSPEEKRFKDQHEIEVLDPEGHGDDIKPKTQKKKRLADYMDGADKAAYDKAYTIKKEEVEEEALDEEQEAFAEKIIETVLEQYGDLSDLTEEELENIIDQVASSLED